MFRWMGAIAIVLIFTAGGCAPAPPPKVVPFDLIEGHMYVPATVNGEGPYLFVVDTGAAHTLLSPRAAGSESIERGKSLNVFGFGPTTRPITALDSVHLGLAGGITLPMQSVDEGPAEVFSFLNSAAGQQFDGILGHDLFARYVVEIDADTQTLRLHEPASFRYRGSGARLKLRGEKGTARVRVGIIANEGDKPVEAWLVVDTGALSDVVLCKPFLERHPLDEQIATRQSVSGGLGGTMAGTTGRIAGLKLGPYEFSGFYAHFARAEEKVGDGVVGQGVLLRFKVFVDYTRGQLILEPRRGLPGVRSRDRSGTVLMAEGATLRECRIMHVFEDSPAAQAGLRAGDKLIWVDGQSTNKLTLDAIRDRFRQAEPCPVTIRRGYETIQTVIQLRSSD